MRSLLVGDASIPISHVDDTIATPMSFLLVLRQRAKLSVLLPIIPKILGSQSSKGRPADVGVLKNRRHDATGLERKTPAAYRR